jgi:adenylate cyclase
MLYTTSRPYMIGVQYLVLIVAWTHGCIGLYFWLPCAWFRTVTPVLPAIADMLAAAMLSGLYQA